MATEVYNIDYIAPDGSGGDTGDVYPLTTPNQRDVWTLNAIAGVHGVAEREIIYEEDGVTVRGIEYRPRNITLPLRFRNRVHMGFVDTYRTHGKAFARTRTDGPGWLRVTRPDGLENARQIPVYYQGGFDHEPGEGWISATTVVQLVAPDPCYQSIDLAPIIDKTVEVTADYLSPYPNVSSGNIIGDTTVNYDGDVEVYPVWTLTGPATRFYAYSSRMDQSFEVTYTLTAGQTLTIESYPIKVTGPGGIDLSSAITFPGSQFWPILPGDNPIEFQVDGRVPGTRIQGAYKRRYETS